MGNASCFGRRGRSKAAMVVVHPLDHSRHGGDEEEGGGGRRLKVRMTSGQLKELMAELKKKKQDSSGKGLSDDDSELGRLVFRECLKGRLHARLVSHTSHDCSHQSTMFSGANISLSTIQERSEDDDDDEDHHDH